MNDISKGIMFFDNYPEAKLALGKVKFPVIIKPYGCEDKQYWYEAENYCSAVDLLYDAFEYSKNKWVSIESNENHVSLSRK